MIFFSYLIIFFFITNIQAEDDNKPPKLDLRNFNGTINSSPFDFSSIIPDTQNQKSIRILDSQIDEIKLYSNEFKPEPIDSNDIIFMHTNYGLLKYSFYFEESPKTCLNFKKLSNSRFYDKTLFHYIIPNFVIQGGDILTRNSDENDDGQGGPGWVIDAEDNELNHKFGTLSMVRTPTDPNSAGSQFFISLSENKNLDGKYTIFGYLIEGKHVLPRISNVLSENGQAKLLCNTKIPTNENLKDWVKLWDPITESNLYSKIQGNIDKEEYKKIMQVRLNNMFRPAIPIIIDSIRVENEK